MRFLFLNQAFYPDVMATGQYLTEVALALVERGHQVTVLTSRRGYDEPGKEFAANETWRGVRIIRVPSTRFGKGARWRRVADFGSFMLFCALRVSWLPRHDVVVALSSPPLISFLGALAAGLRRSRFVYWVMDFNPDEAIAAGWLRAGSMAARVLEWCSRFSLKRAERVIALDRFMRERIVAKGIERSKIVVVPPWSQDDEVRFDAAGREGFRRRHGLEGKFVVMYSGNHSPCHPLDTLLGAAAQLAQEEELVFCFVGGGSEWRRIQAAGNRRNIRCLPYQALDQLSGSLSAADLQVVVMGERFVGIVHPCKLYNILKVGAPVLYIGPRRSHVTEVLEGLDGGYPSYSAGHGEVEGVVRAVREARRNAVGSGSRQGSGASAAFSKEVLLPRLIAELVVNHGIIGIRGRGTEKTANHGILGIRRRGRNYE